MYFCMRCGKKFGRKAILNSHLLKKKECPTTFMDISREEVKLKYKEYYDSFCKKYNHSDYVCEDCNKGFTIKTNYYRHKRKSCKMKKSDFRLNKFGEENFHHICTGTWSEIVGRIYNSILELVKEIYISRETNRNIYISNLSTKLAWIFNGHRWEAVEMDKIIEQIFITNYNRLYDFISRNEKRINKNIYKRIENALDDIDHNDGLRDSCKSNIKFLIFNNRNLIKYYYEKTFGKKLKSGKRIHHSEPVSSSSTSNPSV